MPQCRKNIRNRKKTRILLNLTFICNRNKLLLMKNRMNPLNLPIFLQILLIRQTILPNLVRCER